MATEHPLDYRLRVNAAKLAAANEVVKTLERERGELYIEARDSESRITLRELARIGDLTEGAVVKKLARARKLVGTG
jgi:hypothetical protein